MDYTSNPCKAVIFIGIQASGKSSFYHQYFKPEFEWINLDTLHTRNKERLLIEECLKNRKSFVIDNTNPQKTDREKYILPAKDNGYRIIGYYFQSCVSDCINRNETREKKKRVPDKAIACTFNKLELPDYEEGFDELYYVKMEDGKLYFTEWVDTDNI